MTSWTLRVARQAEVDIVDILAWTSEQFGEQQARTYAETLSLGFDLSNPATLFAGFAEWPALAPLCDYTYTDMTIYMTIKAPYGILCIYRTGRSQSTLEPRPGSSGGG